MLIARNLLMELVGAVVGHRLSSFTCTVAKEEYRKFRQSRPELPAVNQLAINHCFMHVLNSVGPEQLLAVYFDRHEEYARIVNARLQREHTTDWRVSLPVDKQSESGVRTISAATSVPLQCADFLDWLLHRYFTQGPDDTYSIALMPLVIGHETRHLHYDMEMLDTVFDSQGRRRTEIKKVKRYMFRAPGFDAPWLLACQLRRCGTVTVSRPIGSALKVKLLLRDTFLLSHADKLTKE